MRRIHTLPLAAPWFRSVALGMAIFALTGCASTHHAWFFPLHPERELERNRFPVAPGDDVIGRLAEVRLGEGDTLPDLARHFGVGISAISAANPRVDVWVPEAGESVTLPLNLILPDAPRKGIVISTVILKDETIAAQQARIEVLRHDLDRSGREVAALRETIRALEHKVFALATRKGAVDRILIEEKDRRLSLLSMGKVIKT